MADASNESPLVLVVDDTAAMIRLLKLELSSHEINVIGAPVGEETYRAIEERRPALVIMEVLLPGVTGFEVLREIKQRYGLPVLFLTTIDSTGDREQAMELGADDYITKPFRPDELSNRVNLLLRRGAAARAQEGAGMLDNGEVTVDINRRTVRRASELLSLGTNEWALLLALAARLNAPVAAPDLLEDVFGADMRDQRAYLEAYIGRLRRKVEEDPGHPRIVTGDAASGYTLHARRRSPTE